MGREGLLLGTKNIPRTTNSWAIRRQVLKHVRPPLSVKGKVKNKQVRMSGDQSCDTIILSYFWLLFPILSNTDLVFLSITFY